MTEQEWLTGAHLAPMIRQVSDRTSPRKLQLLFAARFARVSWHFTAGLEPPEVTLTELADGLIGRPVAHGRLSTCRQAFVVEGGNDDRTPVVGAYRRLCEMALSSRPAESAENVLRDLEDLDATLSVWDEEFETKADNEHTRRQIRRSTAHLIRDIFGNPFHPVAFDPRWRTSDVLGLARAIYEDRAFDRMPVLADALMDAGCADEQVIGHCRGLGPHVRGCWVVDLVLDRK
jgi:hypothetical protein